MSVKKAVAADLATYETRLKGISKSTLAASALALAGRIDNPKTSTTALSMATRELREHMDRLEEQLPPAVEKDAFDDLVAKRAERAARESAAAGSVAP